ncbi:MAG: ribonuclease J [Firmicutes bacterium]|nr:ribonuclease J [Bacillota bacterium]
MLGGLQEVGKNMAVLEYGSDIIVVDCGVDFPDDDMLGVDLVIPDYSYLLRNKSKVRAVFLTHGHEDHIGSIPYFLRDFNVPIYGTRLTLGLVENKLKEHSLTQTELVCVTPGETIKEGVFEVEFIHTTHSIADTVAFAIRTPVGVVVHTGDFKVDYTPINGGTIDLQRFAELGRSGVLLLMCESTNVEQKGYTMSEKSVGVVLEGIFQQSANQRIMVATFSSHIYRIQQIFNSAVKHNRKVAVVGRSMTSTVKTAVELGYLEIPPHVQIEANELKNYTDEQIVIITTGSQGEPMSALSRMAAAEHKQVEIKPGDKIIISSSAIPGNEKTISKVINDLMRKGADVIYEGLMEVHVSGHAKQEELKLMHALTRPRFFMPIHGEYKHLKHHRDLAVSLGMAKEDIFVLGNGDVLELTRESAKATGTVPSGQVMVDGLGVGDVGNVVLRDRKHLAQDGLTIVVVTIEEETGQIVAGPDIISRGFVYVREAETLMEEARNVVRAALMECDNLGEWSYVKSLIKDTLKEFLWQKTKRSPMILPIIMEV